MKKRHQGQSTTAIHGDGPSHTPNDAVAAPIYQSSTFVRATGPSDRAASGSRGDVTGRVRLLGLERTGSFVATRATVSGLSCTRCYRPVR